MTSLKIALGVLLLCGGLAFATGNDCKNSHNQCGHDDGDDNGGQAQSESESNSTAESTAAASAASYSEGGSSSSSSEGGAGGSAESTSNIGDTTATGGSAEGGSVGDINISTGSVRPADTTHKADIRIENTPDIVTITPGSGDACKAHIGANLSIPGLGTGLNIPLPGKECRKLKYYDRMIAMGDFNAAEIIFCALKEISREFNQLGLDCRDTLSVYVEPVAEIFSEPQESAANDWSANDLVAQLSEEQYEELKEKIKEADEDYERVEYVQSQQQSTIEVQQSTIEELKREAERLMAEQAARKREEAATQAKFKARLKSKGEQRE